MDSSRTFITSAISSSSSSKDVGLATSCHDYYLLGVDARRRSEPMKQSAWDKSIFHLFRARALLSLRRPSIRRSVSSGQWHRVVCMTVAPSDVATNLHWSSAPHGSSNSGKWPSQVPARIITSDVNVRLDVSFITAPRRR